MDLLSYMQNCHNGANDPGMHHGTCGFLWSLYWGKTFPVIPAHAQSTILPISHVANPVTNLDAPSGNHSAAVRNMLQISHLRALACTSRRMKEMQTLSALHAQKQRGDCWFKYVFPRWFPGYHISCGTSSVKPVIIYQSYVRVIFIV